MKILLRRVATCFEIIKKSQDNETSESAYRSEGALKRFQMKMLLRRVATCIYFHSIKKNTICTSK